VPADAMLGVDNEVAGREGGQLRKEGVGGLPLLAPANEPITKHVLLGQDGNVRRGEAVIERKDEQRRLGLGTEAVLPAVRQLLRLEPMLLEQAAQALARPLRVAC